MSAKVWLAYKLQFVSLNFSLPHIVINCFLFCIVYTISFIIYIAIGITVGVIGCQRLKAFQVPNQTRYSSFLKQSKQQGLFYGSTSALLPLSSVFTVVIVLYNLYQAYEPLELMPRKTDGIVKLYCCFQRALSIIIKLRVTINPV